MYLKLAVRNAKRSAVNYLLYMVTITILVVIMVVSNGIAVIGNRKAGFQTASLPLLIALILVILISYINRFMLKARSVEFANYMLLGIERRKLSGMFFLECFLIGLFCFTIGTMIAFGIIIVIFGAEATLSCFLKSIVQASIYFGMVELLTALLMKRRIDKLQIRELMMERRKNCILKGKKQTRLWGVLFFTSFTAFAILLSGMTVLPFPASDYIISFIAIPLLLSIFAFYKCFSLWLIVLREKLPNSLYQKNRLYLLAQVTSETKSSAILNGVFCVCILFSSMSFVFGMIMLKSGLEVFEMDSQIWMGYLQISISIIFLVIYFSVLSLQQIIELKQRSKDMQLLSYLGKNTTQLKGLMQMQVFIKLALPVLFYFVILLMGVPFLNNKLNTQLPSAMNHILLKTVCLFLACFFVFYFLYFCIVCVTGRRYIIRTIHSVQTM